MSSVGQCAVMLQDDLSFPWTSATNSTMKLLECLKVTSGMDISCFGKNLAYMHSSASQKTVPIVLQAKGITAASFLGQCCVIPLHAVNLFPDQSEEINFHHPSPCHE
jgi:hypothetical protein